MKRTEEEKLAKASLKVMLGGQEYEIKPLVIRDSRPWRKDVADTLASLPVDTKVTTKDIDLFGKVIKSSLFEMPNKVIDLFFGYAKDLDREEIEGIATDGEMAKAFLEVVEMAFPLAKSLMGGMETLSR